MEIFELVLTIAASLTFTSICILLFLDDEEFSLFSKGFAVYAERQYMKYMLLARITLDRISFFISKKLKK